MVDGTAREGTEKSSRPRIGDQRDPNHLGAITTTFTRWKPRSLPERALAGPTGCRPWRQRRTHRPCRLMSTSHGDYAAGLKPPGRGRRRPGLHQGEWRAGHLSPDVLQSQPALHPHVCSMNGTTLKPTKMPACCSSRAPHVKECRRWKAFMTIPIAVDVRSQVGRSPQDAQARSGNEDHDRVLAFPRGMALAAKGKVNEAEAEYQVVSDAERIRGGGGLCHASRHKAKDVLRSPETVGCENCLGEERQRGPIALLQSAVAVQDTLKYSEPETGFSRCASHSVRRF